MKRIFASLFVVGALVSMGVFATSAYFQFQGSSPAFVLQTGSASLQADIVGGTLDPVSPIMVGPGFDKWVCIRITNDGNYALNVTESLAFTAGNAALEPAMFLSINTGANCSISYGTDYTLDQYTGPQVLGPTLGVGASVFVVERLHWNETGVDQSALMNQSLTVVGTITGQTPH